MTDWSEKIDNIDKRHEAARLLVAANEAESAALSARWEADVGFPAHLKEKLSEAKVRWAAEEEAIRLECGLHLKASDFDAHYAAALEAYEQCGIVLLTDGVNDGPLICALSGIPITETDETVTVDNNDRTVIASLILPDEVIYAEEDEVEDEEDDGDEEEAEVEIRVTA